VWIDTIEVFTADKGGWGIAIGICVCGGREVFWAGLIAWKAFAV
jgi:hypothetical protein